MSARKRKNELLGISHRVMQNLEKHLLAMEKAAGEFGLCLEELMIAVCFRLKERGFSVARVPDEDVIFNHLLRSL